MLSYLLKVKAIFFFTYFNCLVSCGFFLHAPHFGDHCFRQPPTLLHVQSQALDLLSSALQASTWCHLSEDPPSITFRSLLHLFFDGRKERCHSCICLCFLCIPASSSCAIFCIPCAVRTAELAGREETGAKQLYGSAAHQQESKQIGRKECCCSITYVLVFPHFPLREEPDKVYGGYICRCCISLERSRAG